MDQLPLIQRRCAYCDGPIAPGKRSDSQTCSKRCRQARHRFGQGAVARRRATDPLRLAYADPPYPGLAARYYAEHPDYRGEVDHRALLSRLQGFDGWALSTNEKSLSYVLRLCAELELEVHTAAWFRGPRPAPSTMPWSAWEPVVYAGGRRVLSREPGCDALVHVARPRTTDPARVIGAKPAAFAYWLFELLGARPGDELHDLFPGSGGIQRAWEIYTSRETSDDSSPHVSRDASPVAARDL